MKDALIELARLRRGRGDHTGALAAYDRLLGSIDDTDMDRDRIQMWRAEAAARAANAR